MSTGLEESRIRFANFVKQLVEAGPRGDDVSLRWGANNAFEELFGYPNAFEPIGLPLGYVVFCEPPTEDCLFAVLSRDGVEIRRVEMERPSGGMGAFGDARFYAEEARSQRSLAGALRAAGKTTELVQGAVQEAEKAEADLREHVLAHPDAFQGRSLAARRVRAWIEGNQRDIGPLVDALAITDPIPKS